MSGQRPILFRPYQLARHLGVVWSLGIFFFLFALESAVWADPPGDPSSSYLTELLQRAHSAGLASHRQWHLLLHYRQNLIGGYTSDADDPQFFLAKQGQTDPQGELDATLRAFFSDKQFGAIGQSAPCAFIARYHWLKAQLSIEERRLPSFQCENFSHWYRELNPQGVTFIFPASYLNNPSSMFGHTLLRIDQVGQTEETQLLAYSINFAAQPNTEIGVMYAIHGLTGGFEGRFSTKPYYLKVREYGDIENRDIWEYRLHLNEEQLRFMLMHVWELQLTHFDYFFFKENCAYQLLSLLEVANPNWYFTDRFMLWTIPGETVRLLTQQPGLVEQVRFQPARTTVIRRSLERLSSDGQNVLSQIVEDPDAVKREDFAALSPGQGVDVIDLAIDYLQYRIATEEGKKKERNRHLHQLLGVRSQMDVRSSSMTIQPYSTQPELGHKPARVGVGGGYRNDEFFEEVNLRAGYHDLLDPDLGYPPYSQIVLASVALRHYNQRSRTRVEKATFADIISLTPVDRLITAPSWKFRFELNTLKFEDCRYCANMNMNGGVGIAREFNPLVPVLIFAIPEFDANYSQAYDGNYRVGGGGSIGFILRLTTRWKIFAQGSYIGYPIGDSSDARLAHVGQRFDLMKNLALRMEFNRRPKDSEGLFQLNIYF